MPPIVMLITSIQAVEMIIKADPLFLDQVDLLQLISLAPFGEKIQERNSEVARCVMEAIYACSFQDISTKLVLESLVLPHRKVSLIGTFISPSLDFPPEILEYFKGDWTMKIITSWITLKSEVKALSTAQSRKDFVRQDEESFLKMDMLKKVLLENFMWSDAMNISPSKLALDAVLLDLKSGWTLDAIAKLKNISDYFPPTLEALGAAVKDNPYFREIMNGNAI